MRAIVTGGAGFIGSHIAKKLVKDDWQVTVVDNLTTGDLKNLRDIESQYEFVKGDAARVLELPPADVVFHQGIYSSSPMYVKDPWLESKVVADATSILEYCKKTGARLVFASTSIIFSNQQDPHVESAAPLVDNRYGEARYAVERLATLYNKIEGVRFTALRYFSIYGDGEESKQVYANLVSQMIWKAILDKPMKIYGDGNQKRDLVHVDDVVKANLTAFDKDVNGVFNVATARIVNLNELVEIVSKAVGKEIKKQYVPAPYINFVGRASLAKAKNELGFTAGITLEEGIKKSVEYYKSLPSVPDIY
jgi:UDP-glucose 4-epimerase